MHTARNKVVPVAISKAEEYRAKARECEALAQVTHDAQIKKQMLEVAKNWRIIAAFEERYAR